MRRALDRWAAYVLLGAGGLLVAVSALFSSGSSNGRLVWIGLAALVVAAAVGAWAFLGLPRPALAREAVAALLLLTAFVTWNGISVLWSIEPDRSWDYLNRGLVYLALALVGIAVGSFLPRAAYVWAYVLAAALALPLGWALLAKAFPGDRVRVGEDRPAERARRLLERARLALRDGAAARALAVGTARARALAAGTRSRLRLRAGRRADADLLARRCARRRGRRRPLDRARAAARRERGGAAAGRRGRARRRGLGVLPARPCGRRAEPRGPRARRRLVRGRVRAGGTRGRLARVPRLGRGGAAPAERPAAPSARTRCARGAGGRVAAGAVGVVVETKPEGWFKEFTAQPTNAGAQEGPGRLATVNSSSRWLWWKEAWHAFEDQPRRGTGAGTFELTHRLLRTNNIVVTEPHNVPLQFLSETGIVGFLLLVAFLAAAGVGVVRAVRRLDGDRAGGRRSRWRSCSSPTCSTRSWTSTGTSSRSAAPSSSPSACCWEEESCGRSRGRGWRRCRLRSPWRSRSRC